MSYSNVQKNQEASQQELEELQQLIQQIRTKNAWIQKENNLFQGYMKRIVTSTPKNVNNNSIDLSVNDSQLGSLNSEQRFIIATSELKETRDEIERAKEDSERFLEQLRSLREETEIRIAEMKKEAYEFRRDIVSGALNPRTGQIMAEKVVKYFEDKLKAKDCLIDKLVIKNTTLKSQCQKLETQLQHKEEMGEVFLPIDFDQLKIENQQYQEKIEERNNELLKLKVTAGNTLRILGNHKKKLYNFIMDYEKLRSEITTKQENLSRLSDEHARVTRDETEADKTNKKLKQQLEEYRVPQVLDYVKLNAKLYDMQKKIKDGERKLEIAQMALKKQVSLSKQAVK